MEGRDDASRHRAADAEGIADRDDPVAHAGLGRIAELDEGQGLFRRDLENREIGCGVLANDGRGIFGAVGQNDGDRINGRALCARCHHVIIGDDIAIGGNDEARAQRLRLPGLRPPPAATIAEAEEIAKGRTSERVLHLNALIRGNVDHGRLETFDHVGETAGSATRRGGGALVLGGLRDDVRAGGYGEGRATHQKRRSDCISITHV